MAKVTVGHPGMDSDDANVRPRRDPPTEGKYAAFIANVTVDQTAWTAPPVPKIRVEFQLKYRFNSEDNPVETDIDKTESGRRVWQDFILAPIEKLPDLSLTHRYELRQLLDACDVERDPDGSFDTDHLLQKPVYIVVKHRPGKEKDRDPETGELPKFTNVTRIESSTPVAADDIL